MNPTVTEELIVALREPVKFMRLERMGSFHQTRLSFMRTLLRRLERETWSIECPAWQIGAGGEGFAVYRRPGD